jgi:hypothetical protein
MKDDNNPDTNQDETKVLGDINPTRREHSSGQSSSSGADRADDFEPSGRAGSPGASDTTPDRAGSRDVTEGVTGGTSVGGARNTRTGSGAAGSDLGNRPE